MCGGWEERGRGREGEGGRTAFVKWKKDFKQNCDVFLSYLSLFSTYSPFLKKKIFVWLIFKILFMLRSEKLHKDCVRKRYMLVCVFCLVSLLLIFATTVNKEILNSCFPKEYCLWLWLECNTRLTNSYITDIHSGRKVCACNRVSFPSLVQNCFDNSI